MYRKFKEGHSKNNIAGKCYDSADGAKEMADRFGHTIQSAKQLNANDAARSTQEATFPPSRPRKRWGYLNDRISPLNRLHVQRYEHYLGLVQR